VAEATGLLDQGGLGAEGTIEHFVEDVEFDFATGGGGGLLTGEHDGTGRRAARGRFGVFGSGCPLGDDEGNGAEEAIAADDRGDAAAPCGIERMSSGGRLGSAAGGRGAKPADEFGSVLEEEVLDVLAGGALVRITVVGKQAPVAALEDDGTMAEFGEGADHAGERFTGDGEFHETTGDLLAAPLNLAAAFGDEAGGLPLEGALVGALGEDEERKAGFLGGIFGCLGGCTGEHHRRNAEAGELMEGGVEGEAFVELVEDAIGEENEFAAGEVCEGRGCRTDATRPCDLAIEAGFAGGDLGPSGEGERDDVVDGDHQPT